MPRNFFKRMLPDKQKLKAQTGFGIFGRLLHDGHLWHLNRRTVPKAVAIGLFCAFLPIPFQMLLAAGFAIIIRANIPISVALVWLTNPLTMAPAFYASYKLGALILQLEPKAIEVQTSVAWLTHQLAQIWQPLLLGSVLIGLFCGAVGYIVVDFLWCRQIKQLWQRRKRKRSPPRS
jgi:uncharacterized protein